MTDGGRDERFRSDPQPIDEDTLADSLALQGIDPPGVSDPDAAAAQPGTGSGAPPDGDARRDGAAAPMADSDAGAETTTDRDADAPAADDRSGRHRPGGDSVGVERIVAGNEEHAAEAKRRRKGRKRKAPWWELPLLVAIAIVVAILVKTFLIQPFYIPSASMEKTLHGCPGCHGDRILVNKPIYDLRDPHPGDIVVFHAPPGWDEEPASTPPSNPVLRAIRGFGQLIGFVPPDGMVLVKRVIAIGGQTVKGDSVGNVFVSDDGPNGHFRKLDEPYVYDPGGPGGHAVFGPVTVPNGRLWVMGDHRNDSADSRFHCGPHATQGPDDQRCDVVAATVPISDVIGKAVIIAWPPSRWRTLGTPATFKHGALAAGSAVPAASGALVVVPLYLVRRRRRRRR